MTPVPSWKPNPLQQKLLDACLLEDAQAWQAWKEWCAQIDVDAIDGGSYRLMPLAWKRLISKGAEDPSGGRFKGVYRRSWYHNQLAMARTADLIGKLTAAAIPAMLLKGAALTVANYQDPGVRPMADIDVAVPRRLARQAVEALTQAGWTPGATPLTGAHNTGAVASSGWKVGPRPLSAFDEVYFCARHAHGFEEPTGLNVDLHWCLFQGNGDPGIDDEAWAGARPVTFHQSQVLVPEAAVHLLLLVAHGSRWNPTPAIRWIADAVTLIRSEAEIRWDRLVAEARSRRITLQTLEMLGYLEERFKVGVPADVMAELRATAVSRRERAEYRVKSSRPGVRLGLHELRWLHERHRLLRKSEHGSKTPGFATFMRQVLDAPSLLQVGVYAGSEIARRVRGPASERSLLKNT